jgi:hypothetical protein
LIGGSLLPPGWCGKQFACWNLAASTHRPYLLFMDADVRLEPGALARLASFLENSPAALASGIPRQEAVTFVEQLLLPLIHFLLLGFLPIERMRRSSHPAYAAACGQLILVKSDAYWAAGGHEAIRGSLHDGLTLPRAFRRAGFLTDICDATDLACCRMYRSAGEVWFGLLKNAGEGLAAPRLILPATFLLLAGQIAPFVLLPAAWSITWPAAALAAALCLALAPRLAAARKFHQPYWSAFAHPLGIVVLLLIQWTALFQNLLGRPATWKRRAYGSRPASSAAKSSF